MHNTFPRHVLILLATAFAAMPVLSPRAEAAVEVNVTHVGFRAVGRGDVVRAGSWAPVLVDLALTAQQVSFDGRLRVGQTDADGDECYDEVEAHLRADTGGTQRAVLYALPTSRNGATRVYVELFDAEGHATQVVSQGELTFRAMPAEPPELAQDDDVIILEVSAGTGGRVQDLVAPDQAERMERRPVVALASPSDLPELWIGLDMVDHIIWEDADPAALTNRQLAALLEWTRQGGTLLVAAARGAPRIVQTAALAEALPVQLGDIIPVDDLVDVRERLLNVNAQDLDDPGFSPSVPLVRVTPRPGAKVLAREDAFNADVITRGALGRGQVLFCAIALKDLFSAPGAAHLFFQTLFGLKTWDTDRATSVTPRSVLRRVVAMVSFATSGTMYLLLAGVLSFGYILAATFGGWALLGRRGWLHHSWTAFALIAVVASLLSVVVVRAIHGFGDTLHQFTVVDMNAGSAYGNAMVMLGIKSGVDRRADFWLPSDPLAEVEPGASNNFLRPMPGGEESAEAASSFADPEPYRATPSRAQLERVRMRATLKRLEGRWSGPVGGRVTGQVFVRRVFGEDSGPYDFRFTGDSYVSSELGVLLRDCYVLHTVYDPLVDPQGPRLPSGRKRNDEIYAYYIGDLPGDGSRVLLAPRCYTAKDPDKQYEQMKQNALIERQPQWALPFRSVVSQIGAGITGDAGLALGTEENAILLMSTISEFDALHGASSADYAIGINTYSRDGLRWLDIDEQLRSDQIVLIGFADDPGPVRLFRREGNRPFSRIEPREGRSLTVYRVRIPVNQRSADAAATPDA